MQMADGDVPATVEELVTAQAAEEAFMPEERGGMLWDPRTGECLGEAGKPKFVLEDEAGLQWVLKKLQEKNAKVAEIENNADYVAAKARVELGRDQIERAKKDAERFLEFVGEERIVEVAMKHLPKGSMTYRCIYGEVPMGRAKAGVEVDAEAVGDALAFAQAAPEFSRDHPLFAYYATEVAGRSVTTVDILDYQAWARETFGPCVKQTPSLVKTAYKALTGLVDYVPGLKRIAERVVINGKIRTGVGA